MGFLGGSVVKNLPANAEDMGSIPESGRSLGERYGNPSSILPSGLENFLNCIVNGIAELDMTERLSLLSSIKYV